MNKEEEGDECRPKLILNGCTIPNEVSLIIIGECIPEDVMCMRMVSSVWYKLVQRFWMFFPIDFMYKELEYIKRNSYIPPTFLYSLRRLNKDALYKIYRPIVYSETLNNVIKTKLVECIAYQSISIKFGDPDNIDVRIKFAKIGGYKKLFLRDPERKKNIF